MKRQVEEMVAKVTQRSHQERRGERLDRVGPGDQGREILEDPAAHVPVRKRPSAVKRSGLWHSIAWRPGALWEV